jgi:hypothetical protein
MIATTRGFILFCGNLQNFWWRAAGGVRWLAQPGACGMAEFVC